MPSRKAATISAADFLPTERDLASLSAAAQACEGCPLHANATQAVFGEGTESAPAVFVGEQPGDREDVLGRPFVGPAGQFFRKEAEAVGIDLDRIYLTNAVKHFKWKPQGKRRLHARPTSREISACRPWLESELAAIEPKLLVLMGAVAAQSLLGGDFRLRERRGEPFETDFCRWTLATYHPSALLRAKSLPGGEEMLEEFRTDLVVIAKKLKKA